MQSTLVVTNLYYYVYITLTENGIPVVSGPDWSHLVLALLVYQLCLVGYQ